jgi:hypothetical protein
MDARDAFRWALALVRSDAERRILERRLEELDKVRPRSALTEKLQPPARQSLIV